MEVENSNNEFNLLEKNYFKILYPNQDYKKSLDYQKWKKSIEEKYGKNKNGKEVLCEKDNIIIWNENINYIIKCPICYRDIYLCKYCNKIKNKFVDVKCCYRDTIKIIVKEKKSIYKFLNIDNDENIKYFYFVLALFFIPFFFISHIVLSSIFLFYCDLEYKDGKTYDNYIDTKSLFYKILLVIIVLGYLLSMIIAFTIFSYIIFLIIVILSLPFKLYPVKIIFGFFDSIS